MIFRCPNWHLNLIHKTLWGSPAWSPGQPASSPQFPRPAGPMDFRYSLICDSSRPPRFAAWFLHGGREWVGTRWFLGHLSCHHLPCWQPSRCPLTLRTQSMWLRAPQGFLQLEWAFCFEIPVHPETAPCIILSLLPQPSKRELPSLLVLPMGIPWPEFYPIPDTQWLHSLFSAFQLQCRVKTEGSLFIQNMNPVP